MRADRLGGRDELLHGRDQQRVPPCGKPCAVDLVWRGSVTDAQAVRPFL
jgi:hypothetical protein